MTGYRLTTAATTVVSAFLTVAEIFLATYVAWHDPGQLITLGKLLMKTLQKSPPVKPNAGEVMNQDEVAAMLKVHVSHMYKLRQTPGFPPGKAIGKRARRWTRSSIQAWLDAK
jgi:predicted DNA-binding transcriptional regulator AlpA